MTHAAWKKAERRICRALGGDRSTSPQQTSTAGTGADCTDVPEYVEIKKMQNSGAYDDLDDLHGKAKRRGRRPAVWYEQQLPDEDPDGVTMYRYLAVWFDDYLRYRDPGEGGMRLPTGALLNTGAWLVRQRVGQRLPHASLVRETREATRQADTRGTPSALVVIQVHRKQRRVALVSRGKLWIGRTDDGE